MARERVDTRRRRGRKILGNRNGGHGVSFFFEALKSRHKAEARTLELEVAETETTPAPTREDLIPTSSAPLKWAHADEERIVIRDSFGGTKAI